jgi:hypothetical protein
MGKKRRKILRMFILKYNPNYKWPIELKKLLKNNWKLSMILGQKSYKNNYI